MSDKEQIIITASNIDDVVRGIKKIVRKKTENPIIIEWSPELWELLLGFVSHMIGTLAFDTRFFDYMGVIQERCEDVECFNVRVCEKIDLDKTNLKSILGLE